MVIVCDVDGVLNNLMDVILDTYNNKYSTNYTLQDVTCHNWKNCFDSKIASYLESISIDPGIWNKVSPLDGSQDFIKRLIRDGHQVYLVTNNDPHTYGQKFDWIHKHFPFIEPSNIVCMADKWLFKCDIMIEDRLETLIEKPYYSRILRDQPWNQSNKDYIYGIRRCYNFDEIIAAVNEINDGE